MMSTLYEKAHNKATEITRYNVGGKTPTVGIKFFCGTIIEYSLTVLCSIKFFNGLIEDVSLPTIQKVPIVFKVDEISMSYINSVTFGFFYTRLCYKYYEHRFGYKKKPIHKLETAIEQIQYIKLIDYFTFPEEREYFLPTNDYIDPDSPDIIWKDEFWLYIVYERIQNVDSFFCKAYRKKGYKICLELLNPNDEEILELKKIFKITLSVHL